MKFYTIDNALLEAINAGDKPVRVQIQIDFTGKGCFEAVFEQDIIEVHFYCLREEAGGRPHGERRCLIIRRGFIHLPKRGRGHR